MGFPSAQAADRIAAGAAEMGVPLPPEAPQRLAAFLVLLARWNRVFNLTAVRDPAEMVPRHILDSLAVLPWVGRGELLDVGSGAGLPGIPLALVRPELQVTLVDAAAKRARFQRQAAIELGLANVQVVHARVEALPGRYDRVISRAFAALDAFIGAAGEHCRPAGELLAMKARPEVGTLPPGWHLAGVESLQVPDLVGERHLIRLRPSAQQAPSGE